MKLKRKVRWDPLKERFKNDDEANGMLSRGQRWPYVIPEHKVQASRFKREPRY